MFETHEKWLARKISVLKSNFELTNKANFAKNMEVCATF